MDFAYADIIDRQRPVHTDDAFGRRHPSMSMAKRAKIFAPFAALKGFDEAIQAQNARRAPRPLPDGTDRAD